MKRDKSGNMLKALFQQAVGFHEQGKLDAAMRIYLQVLAGHPEHADSLSNLAAIHVQHGDLAQARQLFERALKINANQPDILNNLGLVLHEQGKYEAALACYDRALMIDRSYLDPHNNRGVTLEALKRHAEALSSYDLALSIAPRIPGLHVNRGNVLRNLQRYADASVSYDRAITLKPDYAEAFKHRGDLLRSIGRYEDALKNYERALQLKPDYLDACLNHGATLYDLRRFDAALQSYDNALTIAPGSADAWSSKGGTLNWLDRTAEATSCIQHALAINPSHSGAYNNLGLLLKNNRQFEEALAAFERAIFLDPENAPAHWNKATILLMMGRFEEGWRLHEWRFRTDELSAAHARRFSQQPWLGQEDIRGKTILLHAEQGLGDTIQFCRYAPEVEAIGARVILEVYPPLRRLLATLSPTIQVIEKGEALPPYDYHCPLMSLPLAFNTRIDTIPAVIPYLGIDDELRSDWHLRLGDRTKPRIGLAWRGSPDNETNEKRSIPLEKLLKVLNPAAEFHCLQKEIPPADCSLLTAHGIHMHDKCLSDFSDTAAIVSCMDLVITVCTSIAHLAGALGKPTWILLCHTHHFVWHTGRDDSPWYPSARLFRQPTPGDWDRVIDTVQTQLMF